MEEGNLSFDVLAVDAGALPPEIVTSRHEFWGLVSGALSNREFSVVFLHFGIGFSQAEVADRLKVSQQRISRVLSAALEKLRHPKFAAGLLNCLIDPPREHDYINRAVCPSEVAYRRRGRNDGFGARVESVAA